MTFVGNGTCSTCRKARQWLESHRVDFEVRDIGEARPDMCELRDWHAHSGLPVDGLFNTGGLLFRALELGDQLPAMGAEEQLRLLASDGLLVNRPLLVTDEKRVLVGFEPSQWAGAIGVVD